MNSNLMAVLSLVVIVALFAVLIGFLEYLTHILSRTGANLVSALAVTTTIREDCEALVGGVLALNQNLNAAATGLTGLAGAANQRATSLATDPGPAVVPSQRSEEPRPPARWASRPAAEAPSPARTLRTPGTTRPLRDPASARALRAPSAVGAARREFRIRGEASEEQD